MENTSPKKRVIHLTETIVIFGYVVLFFLVIITFLGLYYYTTPKDAPSELDFAFATNLPPITPIPRLSSNHILGENNIFTEEFNDNNNNWNDRLSPKLLEIKDGKLFIQSKSVDEYVIVACASQDCNSLNQPFYMQAEFSTNKRYERLYGFVFKMNYQRDNFLLFSIAPSTKSYMLYSQSAGRWAQQVSGQSDYILEFPNTNVLALYVNKGYLELYINGQMIDTYQDTGLSLQTGDFGFYIDNSAANLIVDNLIIDKVEGE